MNNGGHGQKDNSFWVYFVIIPVLFTIVNNFLFGALGKRDAVPGAELTACPIDRYADRVLAEQGTPMLREQVVFTGGTYAGKLDGFYKFVSRSGRVLLAKPFCGSVGEQLDALTPGAGYALACIVVDARKGDDTVGGNVFVEADVFALREM